MESKEISTIENKDDAIAGDNVESINFFRLFRFATKLEIFYLFIGFIMSAIKALTMPVVVIVYSEFTAMLVDRSLKIGTSSETYMLPLFGGGRILTNESVEVNNAELYKDSISYGILLTLGSIIMFITGILSVDIFNLVALKQIMRMRVHLFQNILRQDISWHDHASKQNFSQNITDDIEKIRDGISEKVGHFIFLTIGLVVTVSISFAYGWKLTLAVSVYIPIVVILNYYVAKFQSKLTSREQQSYANAGNLVEEVLSSIRIVMAFGGEKKESERYDEYLVPARVASQRKGAFSGFTDGVLRALLFLSCAGAFWYGINLILNDRDKENKEYTPAILMIAFFGIIIGADNITRATPFLESFSTARGCAANIYRILDRVPEIDALSTKGKILNSGLTGAIQFQDVFFRYPTRKEIIVHRGLSFQVKPGQVVALVGASGCGKSTCMQLLQRFYDTNFGSILLDDLDITKYNLQWLRSNMAVVEQEPITFQGTIAENISFGNPNATQSEIEAAAKSAGVHDFIIGLPESYNTSIGERGTQLSGGQKQRIAIARAVIQNPKILLLDEATSALDYESEKQVQEALNAASKGRTTIVVSHRLSAIQSADIIFYLQDGKVVEQGSHEQLLQLKGLYYNMVQAQSHNLDDGTENSVNEKTKDSFEKPMTEKSFIEKNLKKHSLQLKDPLLPTADKFKHLEQDHEMQNYFHIFARLLKLARREWCFLLLGASCSILFGFTYPMFAVAFGEFYAALSEPTAEKAIDRTIILCICCVILAALTGLACFVQTYLFNYGGVWLTTRIRSMSFKAIVRQEIGWFDHEDNSVGALSARLSGDASSVQGAIGYPLSGLIQAFSNFIISITLAFYYSWKLALLCLSTCPIIVGSVIFEAKFMTASIMREKVILEEVCRIGTEAITNIRTIAALRMEKQIIEKYNMELTNVEMAIKQKLKYRGLVNSSGQAFLFFAYAVALCYGGVLVSEGKVPFQDIIKVSETLLYGSMMLAQSLAFAPAFTAALVSAQRLFKILDRKPKVQSPIISGDKIPTKQLNFSEGIFYHNIEFSYPTRPNVRILRSFNLEVLKGKTVALVGHSGCGKSTCVQLLQRYYDPDAGSIYIDHNDIRRELTLEGLRSKMGIVSQEPALFERTIAENISYGNNACTVSMAEIIAAAKTANAHSFITALPNGYETKLGQRGTQLSGGQKQRIAIARALIRNPKVLLLDEATSALDLQSEQIVQQALDVACEGRTCIVIAHRLSTIQNADLICVFENGRIIEQGNHQQLLAKNGAYKKLYTINKL